MIETDKKSHKCVANAAEMSKREISNSIDPPGHLLRRLPHRSAPKDSDAQYGTTAVPEVFPTVGVHPGLGMETLSMFTDPME